MEKLIELLNEHEKTKDPSVQMEWRESHLLSNFNKYYIISKDSWFIKWLVENDHVDFDKLLEQNWLFRVFFYNVEWEKNYDRLIMFLSIEDKPILFLSKILK